MAFNKILAVAGFRCNVQEQHGVSCLSELSGKGFTFSADGFVPQYTDVPAERHNHSVRKPGREGAMKFETGQVAVVTGGTSGIGFALAALLVRRGVNVMIADMREDAIPAAVDALSRHPGGRSVFTPTSASTPMWTRWPMRPSNGSGGWTSYATTRVWCASCRPRGSSGWRRGGG